MKHAWAKPMFIPARKRGWGCHQFSREMCTFTFCLGDSASIAIMPVKSQSSTAVLRGRSGYSESVRSACSYHTACGRQSPRTAHRPSGLH